MRLITQADIARKYGVSREAVRKWTHKEAFPVFVGTDQSNCRLYDESAVEFWHDNRVPVKPGPKKLVDTITSTC